MSSVTYSAEDNKIRLYVGRVPRDEYEALRSAGFVSTPKQDCDFVAVWTPQREDLAKQYLEDGEDIGDEDYSPLERSADRAERFEGYREKRTDEATAGADQFDAGPAAFGHQSRARAERQARRHDRNRTYAVSQWSKAEYWQQRTEGVIANALYKSSAKVRRGRVLTLESELRRLGDRQDEHGKRWKTHLELRLTYERAMLAQEGGSASDAEMEQGGWIGAAQIHKVNKSPITGLVVSVTLKIAGDRWGNSSEGFHMRAFNVQRLPEGAYRAPTDEERASFQTAKKEAKAAAKASQPKEPSLINPTDADAEKLQAILNEHEKARHHGPASTVRKMTQAEYSQRSKGEFGSCRTSDVSEQMTIRSGYRHTDKTRETVFKVRTSHGENYAARRVIILTDKPQKPLPWGEVDEARAKQPTEAEMFPRLEEIAQIITTACGWYPRKDEDTAALLQDARYVGWFYQDSETQFGWTAAGIEAYKRFKAEKEADSTHAEANAAGLLFA